MVIFTETKSRNESNHIQFKLVPFTISCHVTDVEMYLFTVMSQRPRWKRLIGVFFASEKQRIHHFMLFAQDV